MFYKIRLFLSSLLLCSALVACDNNVDPQATSDEIIKQEVANVVTDSSTTPTNKIEIGMSEHEVTAILGDATLIQTRTLDALTITHSEWASKSGTTSVQFQNGKVQFSQFIPSNK